MNRFFIISVFLLSFSCSSSGLKYDKGDMKVSITVGFEWQHSYSQFQKNPPQFAFWAEDENGKFLGTLLVSKKIATGGWIFNNGNQRIESLPVWSHKRGILNSNRNFMPTKTDPVVDGISSATPVKGFEFRFKPLKNRRIIKLYAEFNHSTDFNDHYPADAGVNDDNYSGGKDGSGQPSIVYSVTIDLDNLQESYEFTAEGCGSPSGRDGNIHPVLQTLSTAINIIGRITIEVM